MKCPWYGVCPLRRHEKEGRISSEWKDRFCRGEYRACERYRLEYQGIPHSDELLPDGSYIEDYQGWEANGEG
jgi:hypothetical protein